MGLWRLGLVLFQLCLSSKSRGAGWENSTTPVVSQQRVIPRGWDLVPICVDVVVEKIWLVACKVKMGAEDCLRRHNNKQQSCDPRFSLPRRNHTVFLDLTALTPADSGLYTCRCVGGIHSKPVLVLEIHITVTGEYLLHHICPAVSASVATLKFHFTYDAFNVHKTIFCISASAYILSIKCSFYSTPRCSAVL